METAAPRAPADGLPRRRALSRGAAATLAAARLLAPALFAGCAPGLPPNRRTVPIGLLHSQTGPLAISATGLRDIQYHAVERINAAGGVLGRQVEISAPDPRSQTALFAKRAERLLADGAVALFGCWTSASRKAVLPVLEAHRRLLFYAVQYEGNESDRHVVYGGCVPNQQILPAIDWLTGPAGGERRKIFLLGSDYIYPRTANYIIRRQLAARNLEPVGERYVPLGERDFSGAVAAIRASGADCVFSTVNGDSNLGLFPALAAAEVDPERTPVMSTSIGEDELRSLLPKQVAGHLAVAGYFQSLPTEANRDWMAGFRAEFGYDRVAGDAMEAGWCLVNLWKAAVEKAGSFETEAVRQAFRAGLSVEGPGGPLRLDPRTQHCTRSCRIGRIRRDGQFDILHTSAAAISPDPYPEIAFPGWSCDWTRGGVTRGQEVDIDGQL